MWIASKLIFTYKLIAFWWTFWGSESSFNGTSLTSNRQIRVMEKRYLPLPLGIPDFLFQWLGRFEDKILKHLLRPSSFSSRYRMLCIWWGHTAHPISKYRVGGTSLTTSNPSYLPQHLRRRMEAPKRSGCDGVTRTRPQHIFPHNHEPQYPLIVVVHTDSQNIATWAAPTESMFGWQKHPSKSFVSRPVVVR